MKGTKSKRDLTLATVAMTPDLDPQISRDRMKAVIEETKRDHPDVRVIFFGETILGWFYKKGETQSYLESIAESIPGPSTSLIAELAQEHNIYICFGLTEAADGKLYNSQVLIDPSGGIVVHHRKVWIRNKAYSPGDRHLTTATIDGVNVAMLICADARSLKLMRAIRRSRTDIVFASLADYATNEKVNQLMGAFYDAWTIVANRYSTENGIQWHGLISITDPWARLCAYGISREQVLVHRLTLTNPGGVGRWLRRVFVGFKFAGLATVLTIQMVWARVSKKRGN